MEIPKKMLAAQLVARGQIEVREVDVPVPGPGEVLIRVEACGICGTDVTIRDHGMPGEPPMPFTMGHEYAGVVVQLGPTVDEFKVGDRVASEVHKGCGRCHNCIMGNYTACLNFGKLEKGHSASGMTTNGGFAQYAIKHVNTLYKMPDEISFEEAAIITTAGSAFYAIDAVGGYLAGDTVAIIGPGPIGLALAQAAKALGADKVILTGTRKSRLELGKKMGADYTVNVREGEDPVKLVKELTGGIGADVVFDAAGVGSSLDDALNLVRPGGAIVLVAFYHGPVTVDINKAVVRNVNLYTVRGEGRRNVRRSLSMAAQRKIDLRPLITHEFPLKDINKAFDTFTQRIDNAMKVIVHPQR
ncbi:MAG TPA: alcohol dehydrogenase catalytic domain-containing protein [Firmicutes bacterium]|uniref:Alcohol dehydrogenase catalytic domain-containing protein n=1 Tax=Capillibacterium thermochitinicola TaxID=2699427 RepID=A0A8J6LMQ0_9FIRM|nr:zinc-binding dehydrogenase [Capillibacterium thermochitinicola]MBA2133999.1 alcohol dehydrogenase catalytic domain-containing protein [Capillibacterium thermochitinicola]HHW11436.1 alcohol dehydrogenase catalytic domain-containing protein [Bacillota bacterium]